MGGKSLGNSLFVMYLTMVVGWIEVTQWSMSNVMSMERRLSTSLKRVVNQLYVASYDNF
jgi:hypothetical protein